LGGTWSESNLTVMRSEQKGTSTSVWLIRGPTVSRPLGRRSV